MAMWSNLAINGAIAIVLTALLIIVPNLVGLLFQPKCPRCGHRALQQFDAGLTSDPASGWSLHRCDDCGADFIWSARQFTPRSEWTGDPDAEFMFKELESLDGHADALGPRLRLRKPTPQLSSKIASLIASYAANPEHPSHSFAVDHGALLLYPEWTTDVGLLPDGTLISVEGGPVWESTTVYNIETPVTPIVVGAQRYPELRQLLPEKPDDAIPCSGCASVGFIRSQGEDVLCGDCHGLGWIDSSRKTARA